MITQYSSYVIIFDDLLRLSVHGHCLSSLNRHDLLPRSRTSINADIELYASVDVEPDITRHFLSLSQFYLISKTSPKCKCGLIWQKFGQRAILLQTGFLWPTHCEEVTAD